MIHLANYYSAMKHHNCLPIIARLLPVFFFTATILPESANAAEPPVPPDLTQNPEIDRKGTYNLGATGLRGWIYTKPANYLDSLQGRTTLAARQILVTHVGAKSPADGVMQVDDVILGVAGKPFSDDARKSIAIAIQEAEKESNNGILTLTRWRAGKTDEVQLKLNVLGTYGATAPYDCPKSKRIFEEACEVLEKEPLSESWHGAVNGLALLATGNPAYLPKLQEFAHKMGPTTLKLELKDGMVIWDWGYRNLFLCEYFLATGDKAVLHAINEYTVTLAKGQSMYGTFGHGISRLTPEGKLHGSIPPYGPVNMAGLPANLSVVMGKKCGVKDPEVAPAIARAAGFFGYFVDKGAIPYGEHEPWPYHENNGKNSITGVMFALQDNKVKEAQFFAKMATAGFRSRECGHTGQGFSYLWSALGANVGGPAATAAFFKESSWHLDLVRRCDGSFTYDGGEQYGPGETDDNTYYGKSSYSGLSPTATYVLTYSLPLKKLYITGKDAKPANWLSQQQVADAIASGRFDLDRKQKSVPELVAAFGDWSPIVRGWAAEELANRPEAKAMVPELITMAKGKDVHVAQGACETLGNLKSAEALPVMVGLLSAEDRWLRYKAAQAIKKMGGTAEPAVPDILKAVAKTAEPVQPINWADAIQFTHGQLAAALFSGGLTNALKTADPKLLYPAIRIVSRNADGMARATLRGYFENQLTEADVKALAPDLLVAVKTLCPADTMFGAEIRMGAFRALTKYHYQEAIEAGIVFAKTQGGHGSENRTGEIMKEIVAYGSAARPAVGGLKEVIVTLNDQCKRGEYPAGELNDRRVGAVEDAIKAIEAATTQPELRTARSSTGR
jgi:HEAT repeat protein